MGPTQRITAADEHRFRLLHEIGCIVCAVYFGRWRTPGDVHHILCGSRRAALNQHQRTILLHPWYHRGVPPCDERGRQLTNQQAYDLMGPSLFHTKREFVERFGTEAELLEMTNALIARMEAA